MKQDCLAHAMQGNGCAKGTVFRRNIMKSHDPRQLTFGFITGYAVSCNRFAMSLAVFVAVLLASLVIGPATAAAADCSKLLDLKLKDTVITEATIIPAEGNVPEYCRVQGGLETVILFETALPTDRKSTRL